MDARHVRFFEDVKVSSREGLEFKKGQTYELPIASANRWIVRGKAEAVETDNCKPPAGNEPVPSVFDADEDPSPADKNGAKRPKKG